MRGRRKKDEAAPPSSAPATPFFTRFLEDQHADDDEAKVTERRGRASYTEKQGARKSTAKASASKLQTLKYPSDNDEYVLYPYKVEAATVKASTRQTLKYPSDRDEDIGPYVPVYLDAADAPKNARAKAKQDAKIRLTTKADDIDQVAS